MFLCVGGGGLWDVSYLRHDMALFDTWWKYTDKNLF